MPRYEQATASLEITYDACDMAYIRLTDRDTIAEHCQVVTFPDGHEIILDLDKDGHLLGIELSSPRHLLADDLLAKLGLARGE